MSAGSYWDRPPEQAVLDTLPPASASASSGRVNMTEHEGGCVWVSWERRKMLCAFTLPGSLALGVCGPAQGIGKRALVPVWMTVMGRS